jgi:hypothetical protein
MRTLSKLEVDIHLEKFSNSERALMSIWIKVEIHNPKEGQYELIDRTTIKRVVDRGEFRTIVFDYATLMSGEEIPLRIVNVVDTLEDLQARLNGSNG